MKRYPGQPDEVGQSMPDHSYQPPTPQAPMERPEGFEASPGYHLKKIPKGQTGEISKILEEVLELQDASEQKSKIMELLELSDILGAMELYLQEHHPHTTIQDLIVMSSITQRAFKNGKR